jgi:hypothetical protein
MDVNDDRLKALALTYHVLSLGYSYEQGCLSGLRCPCAQSLGRSIVGVQDEGAGKILEFLEQKQPCKWNFPPNYCSDIERPSISFPPLPKV